MHDNSEFESELRTELNEIIASMLFENNNTDEIDIIDFDEVETRAKKIISTIIVLSEFIGRLSVNYALLETDDPSIQNANVNYYNLLSHLIGKDICKLAEQKSKELV